MRYTTAFRQLTPVGVCLLLALTATGCGTDSDEAIARRLERARLELQAESEFDAVVENGELEVALQELERLMGLA